MCPFMLVKKSGHISSRSSESDHYCLADLVYFLIFILPFLFFDDLCYLHAHVIIEFEAVLRFGALYYYDCIALNFNF